MRTREKMLILMAYGLAATMSIAIFKVSWAYAITIASPVVILCIVPWRKRDSGTLEMPVWKLTTSVLMILILAYGKSLEMPTISDRGAYLAALFIVMYLIPSLLNYAYGFFSILNGRAQCASVRTLFRVIDESCCCYDIRIVYFRAILCVANFGKTRVIMEIPLASKIIMKLQREKEKHNDVL